MEGLAVFLYSTGRFDQRDIARLWAEQGHGQGRGRVNEAINAVAVYRDQLDDFCPECREILTGAKPAPMPLFEE